MLTIDRHTQRWLAVLVLAAGLAWTGSGLAGELEPPVPPGNPTMKPLNEVEPRRPIYAHMLPLTITDAGSSWYLAESIVTSGAGIIVEVDNVTIDLMGFVLQGGTGPGIDADQTGGLTVRNGTIEAWAGSCVLAGNRARIERVTARLCQGSGIRSEFDSLVIDSDANNNGVHGIIVKAGSIVRGCLAANNDENGIWAQEHSAVSGVLVDRCVADANLKNGIRVDGYSTVVNNQVRANASPNKAGIWIYGSYNRVEGNTVINNNIGIDIDGSYNVITRNMVGASLVDNFDIAPLALMNLVIVQQVWTTTPPDSWANIETP